MKPAIRSSSTICCHDPVIRRHDAASSPQIEGLSIMPKVALCTKLKCAASKEFSMKRSGLVFQVS